MRTKLIDFYIDFLNNFLTLERMAEYYNLEPQDVLDLIKIGKKYFENNFKNT